MTFYASVPAVVWIAVSAVGAIVGAAVTLDAYFSLRYAWKRHRALPESVALFQDGVLLEALRRLGSGFLKTLSMVIMIGLGLNAAAITPSVRLAIVRYHLPQLVSGLIVIAVLLLIDIVRDFVFGRLALRAASVADDPLGGQPMPRFGGWRRREPTRTDVELDAVRQRINGVQMILAQVKADVHIAEAELRQTREVLDATASLFVRGDSQ